MKDDQITYGIFYLILYYLVIFLIISRILLRRHREPAARIAWISAVAIFPVAGIILYILFGEVNVGRKPSGEGGCPANGPDTVPQDCSFKPPTAESYGNAGKGIKDAPPHYDAVFLLGKSINGFSPTAGNLASIMESSQAMIDALVSDIEMARDHVHILYYIWLPDHSGRKVADAVASAARRGVECRIMVDSIGSRSLIKSSQWKSMADSGAQLVVVLPMFKYMFSRIDLRNHRKIVIIDGNISYCGSQNCADEEFLIKAKFAPWVDVVLRLRGPVAGQNQQVFVKGWRAETGHDISDLVGVAAPADSTGFVAQVIATGPTKRHFAMSQIFVALIASARRELLITTPYFVPDEPIQSALQAAAYRGVRVRIVLPERNDSYLTRRVSMSFYRDLLEAGIGICEFRNGLLHAKTLTVDGELAMVGSANMDRRSFDLNFENNMIIFDRETVSSLKKRQEEFVSNSRNITLDEVRSWPMYRQIWNNALASFAPIL